MLEGDYVVRKPMSPLISCQTRDCIITSDVVLEAAALPRDRLEAVFPPVSPRHCLGNCLPRLGLASAFLPRSRLGLINCLGLGSASNFLPRSYSGLIVLGLATNCWVWWCWQNVIKIWIFRQNETLTLNLLTFCFACVCEGEGEHSVLT